MTVSGKPLVRIVPACRSVLRRGRLGWLVGRLVGWQLLWAHTGFGCGVQCCLYLLEENTQSLVTDVVLMLYCCTNAYRRSTRCARWRLLSWG